MHSRTVGIESHESLRLGTFFTANKAHVMDTTQQGKLCPTCTLCAHCMCILLEPILYTIDKHNVPRAPNKKPKHSLAVMLALALPCHATCTNSSAQIIILTGRSATNIMSQGGRCRTVRARCAHSACTVRARFNVFGMVAQLVPR